MTAHDPDLYDDPYEDDWDDDPSYDRDGYDEPDCGACNDHGCRSCRPGRLRLAWWRLLARIRDARLTRRGASAGQHDEPPF